MSNLPNLNTLEPQEGKLGKPFRQTGLSKVLTKPTKWIDKVEKWHWKYTFKYLDGSGSFTIEIGYSGEFIEKRTV